MPSMNKDYWLSTKHLTFGFVVRMLATLNKFAREEGDMNDVGFAMLEDENPVDQMLVGKFVIRLLPRDEL